MQPNQRIHALDTVRAFALLTGIMLHAAMSFMPGLAALGFPADSSQSTTLQGLFYFIHTFRMPLFFLIAGFFAHLMFHRKGAAGFLGDRLKRILVPLIIGWLVFGPISMGLVYVAFGPELDDAAVASPQGGFPLSHLWFLYYLLLLYTLTLAVRGAIARFVEPNGPLRESIDRTLARIMSANLAPAVLAAPIGLLLYLDTDWVLFSGIASPDTGLTPQWPAVIGFGSAFAFGWLLHRQPDCLFRLKDCWIGHMILAVTLTGTCFYLVEQVIVPIGVAGWERVVYSACYSLSIWCWVFGLTGVALKFFSSESATLRYLADSSYWLYLAHLPLVFALQLIARDWAMHWSIKFPMIVAIATGLLLVSYRFLVRNSIIGAVLNGRRHAQADSPINPATDGLSHPVAELSGAIRKYKDTVALDALNLHVGSGEFLALLGPNGAGKTTAISCLLGLQKPDHGSVSLFGLSPHMIRARRSVGVMLQDVDLPSELKVRELIELSASYYPSPLPVQTVLELTRTTSIASRRYGKLSGGQKRLVQFAVAICGRPQLLFLDEPTVGLDVDARHAVWDLLRQINSAGCAIVLTTHYLEEAEALADRVAILSKGRTVRVGTVDEIRAHVGNATLRCISRLNPEQIGRWSGVVSVALENDRLCVRARDADAVVRRLVAEDPDFRHLEITRAGLAEAFTQITHEAA